MTDLREIIKKAAIYPFNATPHVSNHIEKEVLLSVATWLTQFKVTKCLDCGELNPTSEHNADHTFKTEYIIPAKIVKELNAASLVKDESEK